MKSRQWLKITLLNRRGVIEAYSIFLFLARFSLKYISVSVYMYQARRCRNNLSIWGWHPCLPDPPPSWFGDALIWPNCYLGIKSKKKSRKIRIGCNPNWRIELSSVELSWLDLDWVDLSWFELSWVKLGWLKSTLV